ncbi:hypothetical protein X726_28750 [Mesorhizobium sp. L103C105A0]|nr:hypothetical protein X726_28750 [Mesorhizobium sp. L103C105A0]
MVEIKPTDAATMRFAIRAVIGQLLDYRQHQRWKAAVPVSVAMLGGEAGEALPRVHASGGSRRAVHAIGPLVPLRC